MAVGAAIWSAMSAIGAAATSTAGMTALAGAGAAAGISALTSPDIPKSSGPTPLPQAPNIEDSAAKASEVIRRKRSSMTESIYTNPLGVAGQADVARKSLLGQ